MPPPLCTQGFDEGVFGGHFHTANAPPVFGIPGLDVLCYSNGRDWARGMRSCVRHAQAGGVSMLLDSTALLTRRHVSPSAKDGAWEFAYPHAEPDGAEELQADDVMLYPHGAATADAVTVTAGDGDGGDGGDGGGDGSSIGGYVRLIGSVAGGLVRSSSPRIAVATYGNGVPHALHAISERGIACDVIDCPLLSRCPEALPVLLRQRGYAALLLVDVCREGGGPLAHFATHLHKHSAMPLHWSLLSAAPTYNPLGRTLTFISAAKIGEALASLASEAGCAVEAAAAPPSPSPSPSPPPSPPPSTSPPTSSTSPTYSTAPSATPKPPPPKRALVICPGRGSYNASELGSLRHFAHEASWAPLLSQADDASRAAGLMSVTELDAMPKFSRAEHMEPAHSSVLTYTIACADYAARTAAIAAYAAAFQPATPTAAELPWTAVGICGNSLGWYTSVALGGAVSFREGLEIVLTTSGYQRSQPQLGGQLVYPTLGLEWEESKALTGAIETALASANQVGYASISIELGGATVLAADDTGMEALKANLPAVARGRIKYPLVLPGHSAFHTPLMADMAATLSHTPVRYGRVKAA